MVSLRIIGIRIATFFIISAIIGFLATNQMFSVQFVLFLALITILTIIGLRTRIKYYPYKNRNDLVLHAQMRQKQIPLNYNCLRCGNLIIQEDKFCQKCGQKVSNHSLY